MTVLNLLVQPDCVRLFTDTLLYRNDQPGGLCARKCLTGEGFAVAFRGNVAVIKMLEDEACRAADFISAAALLEHTGRIMVEAVPWGSLPGGEKVEAVIAGVYGGKMCCCRVLIGSDGVERSNVEPGVYASPAPEITLPPTATVAQMVKLSLAQDIFNRRNLNMCIGGLLHMTTVTLSEVSQEVVAKYPNYQEMKARFGDQNCDDLHCERMAG